MRDNKGQFAKGNKGRPKGSKNKRTLLGADAASEALNNLGGFKKIGELANKLIQAGDLKDAANILLKMSEFAYPKLKAVDMSTTIQDEREELTPQEIEQRLKEMQEELKQFDDD
jgi:hypothetical protein